MKKAFLTVIVLIMMSGCANAEYYEWRIIGKEKVDDTFVYSLQTILYSKRHAGRAVGIKYMKYETWKDIEAGYYISDEWMEREEKFDDGKRIK